MTKRTYTAVFERGRDAAWEVELAEEARVHTFARTLAKARVYIREATAVWFDVDEDAFDLLEDVRLPRAVKDRVARARREREHAQAAQDAALTTTREAAEALVRTAHLSTRMPPRCSGFPTSGSSNSSPVEERRESKTTRTANPSRALRPFGAAAVIRAASPRAQPSSGQSAASRSRPGPFASTPSSLKDGENDGSDSHHDHDANEGEIVRCRHLPVHVAAVRSLPRTRRRADGIGHQIISRSALRGVGYPQHCCTGATPAPRPGAVFTRASQR